MKPLIYTTTIIAVMGAGYIGLSRESDYHRDLQEENRVIRAYDRGYEAGYMEADKTEFNKYAALAAETHGFSRPDVMPPERKPEDR